MSILTAIVESLKCDSLNRELSLARRFNGSTAHATAVLWAIALLILAPGCSKTPVKIDPNVLAKVGPVEIRVEDFIREMDLRLKANRTVLSKTELLDEMIQQELLVQKARQAGLEKDPDFQRAQKNLLISRFKERELKPTLELAAVPDGEVEARYQQTIDKYTRPAKARLAIIFAKSEPKMTEEKRVELRKRTEEARASALLHRPDQRGFGRLAIDYSEDQASRYKGGDIGWLDKGRDTYRWPKEVVAAGFSLTTNGNISEIVETVTGLYLVARLDWRDGSITPVGEVQSGIRHQLAAEKRRQIEEAFLKKTREGVAVEMRPEALARVEAPSVKMLGIATAKRTDSGPAGDSGPPTFP